VDHDPLSRRCTLDIDEGAGMLDLLAIQILEGADDEEFRVQAVIQHVMLNILLKGGRSRPSFRCDDSLFTDEFEGPSVLHDEVLEEGQRVASLDLLIDDLCCGLLLPLNRQPMHLLPEDEDRVAKGGVDSIDHAVIHDESYSVRTIEKEVVPATDLALIIHRAIGALI
jgi:hypothetical protein